MTVLEQQPLTLPIPLYEHPPGVLRVGKSRVLLELVIRAFQRGATPEGIVQSYDTLNAPSGPRRLNANAPRKSARTPATRLARSSAIDVQT